MTSKIKVDNINKVSDDSNIINKCGTTITLGASGDSIALASGATQTGFGRTGTVDWQTGDIKTGTFTAESGKGYFVNTTSGGVTANLPSSPSAGDIVGIADYAGTAASNNITIGRNSSKIEGLTSDAKMNVNRESKTLVYVDGTQGWVPVNDNADPISEIKYVAASGGDCVATSGNYKIHTFTGPGTFTVSCAGNGAGSNTVDYLVIAGGAGASGDRGGGGGAGGYLFSDGTASGCYSAGPAPLSASALPVSASPGSYPIVVGGGGARTPSGSDAGPGNTSSFSTISSAGGGRGARQSGSSQTGGSGGGGAGITGGNCAGSAGNTPSTTPPQGNDGGDGNGTESGSASRGGGGGGGAGACGTTATPSQEGDGGTGLASSITGSPVTRAGGGGGGGTGGGSPPGGSGGSGGGGNAGSGGDGGNATCNTGSGGGGGCGSTANTGGNGGSGVVIIRYKFQ